MGKDNETCPKCFGNGYVIFRPAINEIEQLLNSGYPNKLILRIIAAENKHIPPLFEEDMKVRIGDILKSNKSNDDKISEFWELVKEPFNGNKLKREIVCITLPGPKEATPEMVGGERLHGFSADLYSAPSPAIHDYVNYLCKRWNVVVGKLELKKEGEHVNIVVK